MARPQSHSDRRPHDVVVVGAGPAGLAAALAVAKSGYRTGLVAPKRTATDERTAALLGGSIALLEHLGVWPALRVEAAPLRTLRIIDGTSRLIRAPEVAFSAREIDRDAFGYNIANAALVTALQAAVDASPIDQISDAVTGAGAGDDEATLDLASGDALSARLIVAADGRRSPVRESAGISTDAWRYDQAALVTNLRHALPHHDTSTEFHTEAGPFTLVPLPGQRSSLVWVDRPAESQRRLALDDDALSAEIEERSGAILGAIAVDGGRQVFPLSGMTARRLAAERVVLVGEAAHVIPPIGAQGLNLGYRDVTAIADLLADKPADPGASVVTTAYETARRGDVWSRTMAVDALNRTLLTPFLPVQAVRGLGLFLLDRVPALRRAAMLQGLAAS